MDPRWRWVILIWLWSEMIGPEFPGDPGDGDAVPTVAKPSPLPPSADRMPLKKPDPRYGDAIDPQAFAASFQRQAQARLIPCLEANAPSKRSYLIAAQINKAGQLRELRDVGGTSLPPCAIDAMQLMNFSSLTGLMPSASQQIQWRLDF